MKRSAYCLLVLAAILFQLPAIAQPWGSNGPYSVTRFNGGYTVADLSGNGAQWSVSRFGSQGYTAYPIGSNMGSGPRYVPPVGDGGDCGNSSMLIDGYGWIATRPISVLSKAFKKHKVKRRYVDPTTMHWHGVISELKADGSWKVQH